MVQLIRLLKLARMLKMGKALSLCLLKDFWNMQPAFSLEREAPHFHFETRFVCKASLFKGSKTCWISLLWHWGVSDLCGESCESGKHWIFCIPVIDQDVFQIPNTHPEKILYSLRCMNLGTKLTVMSHFLGCFWWGPQCGTCFFSYFGESVTRELQSFGIQCWARFFVSTHGDPDADQCESGLLECNAELPDPLRHWVVTVVCPCKTQDIHTARLYDEVWWDEQTIELQN